MANLVKVYYIGTKPRKVDNVSSARNRKQRVWNGFGDALMLPEQEAQELLRFDAVWTDEEHFPVFRKRHDAKMRERVRLEASAKRRRMVREDEGDVDQEALTERGGAVEGEPDGNEEAEVEETGFDGDGKREGKNEGESRDGQPPRSSQERGEDDQDREQLIQGAILSLKLGSDKDYTSQGTPRVARVAEIVGTNVTAEEIQDAMNQLRSQGKLPKQ